MASRTLALACEPAGWGTAARKVTSWNARSPENSVAGVETGADSGRPCSRKAMYDPALSANNSSSSLPIVPLPSRRCRHEATPHCCRRKRPALGRACRNSMSQYALGLDLALLLLTQHVAKVPDVLDVL